MSHLYGYEPVMLNGRRLKVYARQEGVAFVLAAKAVRFLRGRVSVLVRVVPAGKGNAWDVYVPSRWEVASG